MTDDEIEAANAKYNCARIMRLSSGNFALYSPFSNENGLQLLGIGTLEELADKIPTAEECLAYAVGYAIENRKPKAKDLAEGKSLLEELGLLKPETPLIRRI